jgi:hypothetical protein
MKERMDPKNMPEELGMMAGGAQDAENQGSYGPDIWGRIWPNRSPSIPDDKGVRAKTWEWTLDEGENGDCVLAEVPRPLAVHQVFFGWKETRKGSWFQKEYVRCLARKYVFDKKTNMSVQTPTKVSCPFCQVLGEDRWRAIQVGGVVDMRDQDEPFVDANGTQIETPPRMLLLANDSSQKAVLMGLRERAARKKALVGTIFHVARGVGKNTSRVGTNWIPDLDEEVSIKDIKQVYYPLDIDMAYPIFHEKAKHPFDAGEIKGLLDHMLERHCMLSLKHGPKVRKGFVGFDEHGAAAFGIDVDALRNAEDGEDPPSDEDGAGNTPQRRGLRIMGSASDGPSLNDLQDKGEEGSEEPEGSEEEGSEEPEGEEGMLDPADVAKYNTKEINDLAKEWGISLKGLGRSVDAKRLAVLTSSDGFDLSDGEAKALLGIIEEEGEGEGEEEGEEGEDEGIDVDALAVRLLDKDETSITEVREAAEKHGSEIARDGKGRVLRKKTVENLVAHLGSGDSGSDGTAEPWED